MKYMIMLYGSQQDYDAMVGKATDKPAWTGEDFAAMGAFMARGTTSWWSPASSSMPEGFAAPVHARRVELQDGVPVVTDGPYAETQEVLAGYTIVECESFDRATEIAARLANCPPGPSGAEGVRRRPADHGGPAASRRVAP